MDTTHPASVNKLATSSGLLLLLAAAACLCWLFYPVILSLVDTWKEQEEYSHGFFIPVVAAYLIYQRRHRLQVSPRGAWLGVMVVLLGGLLHMAGRLAVISTMGQYAFVICIWGLALAALGWRGFRAIWPALLLLVFMVKLPTFLYNNLSSQLQLISTEIGVWFIRLFDISVYYEGNVIDLGVMQLQVVEACNGLRYLFPLLALSMIIAILYQAPLWRRILIVLSSMPISVLMNSIRIGIIGVTVEYWGKEMAEGVLHDFEGWVVFMGALLVLIAEIKLISWLVGDKRSFADTLMLEPEPKPEAEGGEKESPGAHYPATSVFVRNWPLVAVLACVLALVLVNFRLQVAETVYPDRQRLASFPMLQGEWLGRPGSIAPHFLDELKLDDYVVADYQAPYGNPIDFYVAYYAVQAEGEGTIHSPRSCLPGAGWRIKSLSQEIVPGVTMNGRPLEVNRAIIAKGNAKIMAYYWLQGRNRIITNEFMAKWWIFWDRLTQGRSDGALVRVMTEIGEFEREEKAERHLQRFVKEIADDLPLYIPD
ncbi:MAG: VPLPA-CTERM-specific exosortase XrtD [Pseudomonadota bacterium]|nr:VPLPA-CTERM-specific exosortase XrtD [Pseudomonadota bacterium]